MKKCTASCKSSAHIVSFFGDFSINVPTVSHSHFTRNICSSSVSFQKSFRNVTSVFYKHWMVVSPIYSLWDEEKLYWTRRSRVQYSFYRPINCILDELPSNICYIIYNKIVPLFIRKCFYICSNVLCIFVKYT